jgi:acyl carrier protein
MVDFVFPGWAMSDWRDRWKSPMQVSNANVQDRILALVKAILKQNSIAAEVDPETHLVDIGLTSMDMVNLMLSVEAEFDFTIPQSEITPENFQSVKALELMIVGQLQPEQAAWFHVVPANAGTHNHKLPMMKKAV